MPVHQAGNIARPGDFCGVDGMCLKPNRKTQAGNRDDDSAHHALILSRFPIEFIWYSVQSIAAIDRENLLVLRTKSGLAASELLGKRVFKLGYLKIKRRTALVPKDAIHDCDSLG